jgi:hypothetical protein
MVMVAVVCCCRGDKERAAVPSRRRIPDRLTDSNRPCFNRLGCHHDDYYHSCYYYYGIIIFGACPVPGCMWSVPVERPITSLFRSITWHHRGAQGSRSRARTVAMDPNVCLATPRSVRYPIRLVFALEDPSIVRKYTRVSPAPRPVPSRTTFHWAFTAAPSPIPKSRR